MKKMKLAIAALTMIITAQAQAARVVAPPYLVTIYVYAGQAQSTDAMIVKSYSGISNRATGPAQVAASEACIADGNSAENCKPFHVTIKALSDNSTLSESYK